MISSEELAEHMASCKDRATFSAAIQAALKAVEKCASVEKRHVKAES